MKISPIVANLLATPNDGELANKVLDRFFKGLDVRQLLALTRSDDPEVVNRGAWLASELGVKCQPIYNSILHLISHEDPRVRAWMLDCIVVCGGEGGDGRDILSGLLLLEDSVPFVRWGAMDFLWQVSLNQLMAAKSATPESMTSHRVGISLLCELSEREIVKLLRSRDAMIRKYAAGASVRLRTVNRIPYDVALNSSDEEIRDYARRLIDIELPFERGLWPDGWG